MSIVPLLTADAHAQAPAKLLPGCDRLAARLVWWILAVTLTVGFSNLAVWFVPALQKVAGRPGLMVMRANSALSLVGLACAVLMWHLAERRPVARRLAVAFAAVPVVIGGLTSLEYLAGTDLGLDALLPVTFPNDQASRAVVMPGRMSLNASLSFFLVGWALAGLDWAVRKPGRERPFYPAPVLAALGALPPCFGLVGYLLGQGGFTGILKSTNILLHVALSLVLLALSVLALRPRRQPLAGLFSAGAEGVLLRWLLPGSSAVLLALAWLIGRGRSGGLLAPGEETALMLFSGMILMFILIIAASRAVREQEASAERASQAKDDFLAALSHELRTPLTPVLLSASSLCEDTALPDGVRKQLAMIERNVTLEARMIDDLLDLTRIAKGKLQLRRELCDIHDLLGHVVEIVNDEVRSRRLTLDIQLNAARHCIHGDSARLQQVFWNLLKNAIKFTPPGGRIAIRSRDGAEGQTLVVEIRDSGVGFVPETQGRLFQPFEQGERPGSHQFGGLGLGLAIARAVVDLHGGVIEGRSEGLDQGATFWVTLPETVGTSKSAESAETSPLPVTGVRVMPLRILLVEDNEPTRTVLARLLARAGHEVAAAGSIAEAMALAKEGVFEVLVSDLGLPDGTGLDLLPRLRVGMPELQGIALSGYGMEEDLRSSAAAGYGVHLVKPVKFEQLAQALREVRLTRNRQAPPPPQG